jgi:hypothetical protein
VFPLSAQQPIKVSPDSVLKVMGFAVDQERGQPAGGVDVVVDSSAYAAQYGLPRGDVGHALKNDAYQAVGFTFAMPARTFQPGTHKVYIRIISADKQTYKDGPGVLISIK